MALIKSNAFFTSLLILVALFGISVGGTVHKVGDSDGWTIMSVNYETWASTITFQVGDSLVFKYNKDFHDVTEVTHNDYEMCEPSKPLARYETGSDIVILTKPGLQHFICGFPGHCDMGQKLQIHVLPASLGPVAAPVPGPVRPPSSFSSPSQSPLAESPVNHAPVQYQMGPSPAPHSAASNSNFFLENNTPIIQPNNPSSSNQKPTPSPKPLEDPLEVLPVDDATIATLPYNAASSPCVWSGLSLVWSDITKLATTVRWIFS
ncbi:unnamed protein product [Arabidopsis thaliana]|uniref:Phytocyanin domain-containing protein n=1 Tax=Arabidopsis thaliana TaxID=3702 RepID=A0A654EZ78_ARATH|nr:unnamed protein product [Arabidopsis thaliana]